jgi:hypothetical protein
MELCISAILTISSRLASFGASSPIARLELKDFFVIIVPFVVQTPIVLA